MKCGLQMSGISNIRTNKINALVKGNNYYQVDHEKILPEEVKAIIPDMKAVLIDLLKENNYNPQESRVRIINEKLIEVYTLKSFDYIFCLFNIAD